MHVVPNNTVIFQRHNLYSKIRGFLQKVNSTYLLEKILSNKLQLYQQYSNYLLHTMNEKIYSLKDSYRLAVLN